METKANYIATGAFTLAVIVGAFGFIFWFQNTGRSTAQATYRVVFDGSVSGLRTGAAVLFNGIRVGEVAELALDPDIVFLDEPTSGLDPIGAAEFDELIRTLQRALGLSVFMVTHDLDSLHTVCDRIAVLSEGRIIVTGTIETMLASEHPWLKSYFRGKRGRLVHH